MTAIVDKDATKPHRPCKRRYLMVRDFLPGMLLVTTCSLAALWQTVGIFDVEGARAVVFAPWVDRADIWTRIAKADGRITREGRWSFVVVAVPTGPDFSERIHRLGAWIELNPSIATDCDAETRL